MQAEKLYELVERLIDSDARSVFQLLYDEGKEFTEDEIAEKTGLRINTVRRALNLLLEKGFVNYRKARDPEKQRTLFYWRINIEGLHATLLNRKKQVLERLRYKLEHEKNTYYYICPLDGARYTLDEAMEYDFTCPKCGSPLTPDENRQRMVEVLEDIVKRLEEEVKRELYRR